jgi:hypothetical protein
VRGDVVPLSEHELRVLNEIEQDLLSDDPRFASTINSGGCDTRSRIRLLLMVIAAPVGVGCIAFGLATQARLGAAVAACGFVLLVMSCWAAVAVGLRHRHTHRS